MASKIWDRATGSARLLRATIREPATAVDLPRWVVDAKIRKGPLEFRRPWWNYRTIAFVEARLPAGARVFEFGGGASTLWLLDRGMRVTTVEDDARWFEEIRGRAPALDLRFVDATGGDFTDYAGVIDTEPEESLDLVIVDGQARVACAQRAVPKIRPGGMLLVDDTQWSDTEPAPRTDPTRLRREFSTLPALVPGWEAHHLRGFKPGSWLPVQTTVWVKPS